jgi:ATP-dependent Clp protease ATP-binding subunit ClpA
MFKRKRAGVPVPAVQFVRYDATAKSAIVLANHYTIHDQQVAITTEHLACALATPQVRDHFARFVPVVQDVRRLLGDRGYGHGSMTDTNQRSFSVDMMEIIRATFATADAEDRYQIGAEHLLFALLDRPDTPGARVLLDLGVDPSRDAASWRVPPDPGAGPAMALPPDDRDVDIPDIDR